jgi:hypothetical protein
VIVDRLPIARVGARDTATWNTAPRPRSIVIRDFLGERVLPPQDVTIPGKLILGSSEVPAGEGAGEAAAQVRPASVKGSGAELAPPVAAPSGPPSR